MTNYFTIISQINIHSAILSEIFIQRAAVEQNWQQQFVTMTTETQTLLQCVTQMQTAS